MLLLKLTSLIFIAGLVTNCTTKDKQFKKNPTETKDEKPEDKPAEVMPPGSDNKSNAPDSSLDQKPSPTPPDKGHLPDDPSQNNPDPTPTPSSINGVWRLDHFECLQGTITPAAQEENSEILTQKSESKLTINGSTGSLAISLKLDAAKPSDLCKITIPLQVATAGGKLNMTASNASWSFTGTSVSPVRPIEHYPSNGLAVPASILCNYLPSIEGSTATIKDQLYNVSGQTLSFDLSDDTSKSAKYCVGGKLQEIYKKI